MTQTNKFMKHLSTIVSLVLLTSGCKDLKQSNTLITIDVTASYPTKKLILQDFMDVEYIALETNDEFINNGSVLAIGDKLMVVSTGARDGAFFIYDRTGKGLRKINRQGRGSQEYVYISQAILDEDHEELFINDYSSDRIQVYDLFGKFKRSVPYQEGCKYHNIYTFDDKNFICEDSSFYRDADETDKPLFVIISKEDGSVVKEINTPFKEKKSDRARVEKNGIIVVAYLSFFSVIPYHGSWILTNHSSDTVFRYLPDHSMVPFMTRIPSLQTMKPEVFLFPEILTERYYFLQTLKLEPEFTGTTGYDANMIIPKTYLAYDRREMSLFKYTVLNGDFATKVVVDMSRKTISDEIAFYESYGADVLVEAYKKGELKGKLREVAAGLVEDANPVVMLVKHKK